MFGVIHTHIGGKRKVHGGFKSPWDAAYHRDTQFGRGQVVKYTEVNGVVQSLSYVKPPAKQYDFDPRAGDKAPQILDLP